MVCREAKLAKRRSIAEVAGSSPVTASIKPKKIQMTISEKEIRDDFKRFIRHEAMRANIKQDELRRILGINN